MAISNSTDRQKPKKCIARAFVFSGRPDPAWEVKPRVVQELQKIWRTLKPENVELSQQPSLGYRGCFLKCPGERQWTAFDGLVFLKTARRSQLRRDVERRFERTLLASAPPGKLPPWAGGTEHAVPSSATEPKPS
jgi:hypothetical protein